MALEVQSDTRIPGAETQGPHHRENKREILPSAISFFAVTLFTAGNHLWNQNYIPLSSYTASVIAATMLAGITIVTLSKGPEIMRAATMGAIFGTMIATPILLIGKCRC